MEAVARYSPSGVVEGILFMGIALIVMPVQDLVEFWRPLVAPRSSGPGIRGTRASRGR